MLPFTADAFVSFLAQYNAAVWPGHIPALVLGVVAVLAAVRPRSGGGRIIAAILAAAWICSGWIFHIAHFATLHFAAPAFGLLFILQGLWLAWAAVRGGIAFRFGGGVSGWSGLGLAVAALAGLPWIAALSGHGWAAAPAFGVAPGPTALFTLGMLLLAEARVPIGLLFIPALWSFGAGAAGWALGLPEEMPLPAAALVTLALAVRKNRRRTPGG